MVIALLYRSFAVYAEIENPLISAVRQNLDEFADTGKLILKQLEIVSFTHLLCNTNHFGGFTVYDDLRFDCVPLFLTGIPVSLPLFGRSVTSAMAILIFDIFSRNSRADFRLQIPEVMIRPVLKP